MSETCINCRHFDPEDTALTICVLHRCFMQGEWGCGDFESEEDGDDDAS